MANVLFKKGLSTALQAENFKAQDGTFYLTTDTNRLYVGNGENLAEINRYIKTVKDKNALRNLTNLSVGDFVYIVDGNILAVYDPDESNPQNLWVQVNGYVEGEEKPAGVNIDTYVHEIKFEKKSGSDSDYDLILVQKQRDAEGNVVEVTPNLSTSISIPVTSVGLSCTYDEENNSFDIGTTGSGADATKTVTIAGGQGITITEENDEIIISGKDHSLVLTEDNEKNPALALKDNEENISNLVSFSSGDSWIEAVKGSDNSSIELKHKFKNLTNSPDGEEIVLSNDQTFNAITEIRTEQNHIIGIDTVTYRVVDTNTTYTPTSELNSDKKLVIGLKDQENNAIKANPLDISFKANIDGTEKTIHPTESLGNLYSKEEIDRQNRLLNAMRYRGPVENFEDLPTTGKIGDTYKVSKEFNISIGGTTIDLKVGDLLILNGTEEDGIVKNISWDRIESGESADTTYTLSSAEDDTNILLSDSHGNIQNYEIRSAGPIEVTNRLGKDNNTNPGIDIEHSVVVEDKEKVEPTNTSTSTNYGSTFKIVSDVVANKYGHVTEIKTQDITLPSLIRDVIVADSSNNSLIFKDGESNKQGSLKLVSGKNTSISSDANNSDLEVTISHETITSKNLSESNAPKHGETFTAIASLMVDNGHVTEITTSDITLPTETIYSIEGPTQNANGIQWELKDSEENNKGIIKMISDTLNISVENESAKVEMVWGEF